MFLLSFDGEIAPLSINVVSSIFGKIIFFGGDDLRLLAYMSVCVCKLTGGGGDPPKQGFSQRSVRPNIT